MLSICAGLVVLAAGLPEGAAPAPVSFPHFPDRVHAFVWRNWPLTPVEDIARVLQTTPENVTATASRMGLGAQPAITPDQRRRSYITVIRRNWHLLPYEQLLDLLGWDEAQLAYTLREDDFLWVKLGMLKPKCEPLKWTEPVAATAARAEAIGAVVREAFPNGVTTTKEPLFAFVEQLSAPFDGPRGDFESCRQSPRFCYSYFALYGDTFADGAPDPFPDGYLARLAASGVNAVWLQAVLYKLAPFPWDEALSEGHEQRRKNLNALVERAKARGIGVYIYLNEPRAMPVAFFEKHPELKGVVEGDHAAMCTSSPAVQQFISSSVAKICEDVPNLAGFFTITASENLTNCWSHFQGKNCARCADRAPDAVIAEVNALVQSGIEMAAGPQKLIAWDWGWADDWAESAIRKLPGECSFMSVSEWSIPITRGGVESVVGEYSISAIGPGPRAMKHFTAALSRFSPLPTVAKIQANTTWECGAVPYIPALDNVATHASNLRNAQVNGIMFGWTLGGYPSPNLEVAGGIVGSKTLQKDDALLATATRRYGQDVAKTVVEAWKGCSTAFSEYPYHVGVMYNGPQHAGPSNLLWETPTGYASTMVGFPYDALDAWRAVFPPDVYIGQMSKVASGFEQGEKMLGEARASVAEAHRAEFDREHRVMRACAAHFRSCANQARFIQLRNSLEGLAGEERSKALDAIEQILRDELELARQMFDIQSGDSRIGFEASNHYFYVPIDLVEKAVNCRDLLERWLPEMRNRV